MKMAGNETNNEKLTELEWVRVYDEELSVESTWDRGLRKMKEDPAIPIGCLLTVGALSCGIWSFLTGRRKTSQYMMRARVLAQAFTIVATLGAVAKSQGRKK